MDGSYFDEREVLGKFAVIMVALIARSTDDKLSFNG
jgi:hypothetical protein